MTTRTSSAIPLRAALALATGALIALAISTSPAGAGTTTQPLTFRGTTTPPVTGSPSAGGQIREVIRGGPEEGSAAGGGGTKNNRSKSKRPKGQPPPGSLPVPTVAPTPFAAGSTLLSFHGIDHFQQRFSDPRNGNFSLEPPDQGLCVSSSYVLENVNTAYRVYTKAGAPVTRPISLNELFDYPPGVDRTAAPITFGPFVTDPSCHFDPAFGGHWYQVILTLDVVPATGDFTGGNHIDIAVSKTADPTGAWNLYSFRTEDDGSAGQPKHKGCVCIGDYPHIGFDANGMYITTNEYPFFTEGFVSAQVYAISKAQLAMGASNIEVVHVDDLETAKRAPGFTVWPALSNPGDYATEANGTEYFLSSMAAEEANGTGMDNRIAVWALTNTASLNSSKPKLELTNVSVVAETYGVPPLSEQKAAPTDLLPLLTCLNDTALSTPFGPGCWQFFFVDEPAHNEVEGPLDSLDSRMQQVWYVNGKVLGSLGTIVNVVGDTETQAGIAWFAFDPELGTQGHNEFRIDSATLLNQGYVAALGNNVIMPAIATLPSEQGAMAFTLSGKDYYPGAAYAKISPTAGAGPISIASPGVGPQDGFTEYKAFTPRPRWGDYGAAASDGSSIWLGSEYIGQACTYSQWLASNFTCGNTRTAFANWGTRVSSVAP